MTGTQLATATEALTQAIRARRVMTGRYPASGDSGERVFYPHVLYRSAAGELIVEVFQVDGPSRGRTLPDWRVLKVAGLCDLQILETVFLPVPRLDLLSPEYRREILADCAGPRITAGLSTSAARTPRGTTPEPGSPGPIPEF